MFAKLLKHEWRSNAVTFGILSAAVLILSIPGGLLLRQLLFRGDQLTGTAAFTMGISLFFIFLSLIGYLFAVQIILLVQYYKNKFTDEGYLTFTLPVSVHDIFLSSAANMMLWQLICGAVLLVAIVLLALTATVGMDTRVIQQSFDEIGLEVTKTPFSWLNAIASVVGWAYTAVMPMICLTIGAILAKKHKILASFGIYYLISMVMGIFETFMTLTTSSSGMMDSEEAYMEMLTISTQTTLGVQLAILAVGYWISTTLMKRKLNLN